MLSPKLIYMASFQSLKKFSVPKRDNTFQLMHAVDQRRRARMAARRAAPARFIRPARAGETKGMDTDISVLSIVSTTNTNANIGVLNLVQQGAGAWNRVGRKIHAKSVRIKGVVNFSSAPTLATGILSQCAFRMILVWDKQPSGSAIPSFDTIFGITAQDGTESCPDITCPLRYDNMDRFRILKDWFISPPSIPLAATGTAPNTFHPVNFDEYTKLPMLESVYSGQSQPMTIADVSTGALYLIMRQTSNSGTASQVTFDGIARLRYRD